MSQPIFILKVALSGRKTIWRRIALEGNDTLDDLHEMIFSAFDRYDEHLYSFFFPSPKAKKNLRSIMRDAAEYTAPFVFDGPFADSDKRNAAKTSLVSLKLKPKRKFYYLFDFGDEWWHEITVEAVEAPKEKGKYPRVLESRGKSPPQYPDYDEEEDEDDD